LAVSVTADDTAYLVTGAELNADALNPFLSLGEYGDEGCRIALAQIADSGVLTVITGFQTSPVRNGVGSYTVLFDTPFSEPPAVVVGLFDSILGKPSGAGIIVVLLQRDSP